MSSLRVQMCRDSCHCSARVQLERHLLTIHCDRLLPECVGFRTIHCAQKQCLYTFIKVTFLDFLHSHFSFADSCEMSSFLTFLALSSACGTCIQCIFMCFS